MRIRRNSNIEMLRIMSMFLIILHHGTLYSGFDFPLQSISISKMCVDILSMGGKIGVSLFILITGYFLSQSEG